MKHYFNQYYYTAAPDLFNKTRKSGWGIFGSSTPDDPETNEQMEQISKDWVPMRLLEEKAFPIEYVMYVGDRYVAGGTTSCNTLIRGDNRPNIWTHVLVPEEKGEESFLACLAIDTFEQVQRKEKKIVLQPIAIEDSVEERGECLKSWRSAHTDAALLKELLIGLSGANKKILITDDDLTEDDFEEYQHLARVMMAHIYQLLPGCMRKKLNFISPMVPKYFQLSSEKPKGARFYFGPKGMYDHVISMQQGYQLNPTCFYDHILLKMAELHHDHCALYEEIGQKFQKNSYAIRENDYIWHFIYEMTERGITFECSHFGKEEYLDAYNQAWNDENRKEAFFQLTEILQKQKKDFCLSEECFIIFCRMIRGYETSSEERRMQMIGQAAAWILETEDYDFALIKTFVQALSKANMQEEMIYQIKYLVMQKSSGFQKEAQHALKEAVTAGQLRKWMDEYAPIEEKFQTELDQKRKALFHKDRVSFRKMQMWQMWKQEKDDLKALDEQEYQVQFQRWRAEFWNQITKKDILLRPYWKDQIREIADDLGIPWKDICQHFSADLSKASVEWKEEQIQESRKLAAHLEPSIRRIFENICDSAEKRLLQEAENERIRREKEAAGQRTHVETLFSDDENFINWVEENYENYQKSDFYTQLKKKKRENRLMESMKLILLSVFWTVFNLCLYEGILKAVYVGVAAAVAVWAAAIVISAGLLFMALKRKRGVPKMVILFLGSFIWTACAAVIRVLFGFLGEGIFLGVLFLLMLILYLISSDEDER